MLTNGQPSASAPLRESFVAAPRIPRQFRPLAPNTHQRPRLSHGGAFGAIGNPLQAYPLSKKLSIASARDPLDRPWPPGPPQIERRAGAGERSELGGALVLRPKIPDHLISGQIPYQNDGIPIELTPKIAVFQPDFPFCISNYSSCNLRSKQLRFNAPRI
jgi:hypothetical protein